MTARDFFISKYGYPTDFTSRFALKVLEEFEALDVKDAPIEMLNISVRGYNALKENEINKISELSKLTDKQLLKMLNFGFKALKDVRESLAQWEKENE